MKSSCRSLSVFLIATTALIAPNAIAQEADATNSPEPQQQSPATGQQPPRDTIVVLGEFIPEPLQETSEVAAFLTDADLERQGDSSAAEALTRVTGLSINEGRFVYVRGLGERYSSAILNGSPLPSPEPLQRVVPLDLFPTSILGGVTVQKSYSVEYPAEFGGGVVDLSTIDLPDSPFLEAGIKGGVNTESTLATGYTYDGSNTDVLGFDDGLRKIPYRIHEAFKSGLRISSGNFTDDELRLMGQSLENSKLRLLQTNTQIPGNGSADISAGTAIDVGDTRFGFYGTVGYSNDWKIRDGIQQAGRVETSLGQIQVKDDYNYTTTDNNISWNALGGAGIQFGEHEIKWTNLWVHNTTKEAYRRFGVDEGAGSGNEILTERTAWYERELWSSQLAGAFDFGDLDVNVRAGYAQTSREAPYEWEVRYVYDPDFLGSGQGRYIYDGSTNVRNQTNFSDLTDEVSSAGIDVSYALPNPGVRDTVISAGLAQSDNSRKSSIRTVRFQQATGLDPLVQQERVDYLFADINISPDGFVLAETTNQFGSYDAQLETLAAYAKIDMEPIPYVRTTIGVRGEKAIEALDLRSPFSNESQPTDPPKLKEGYWLPAATVTWNFLPDMQVRLGASQTIGRPQFRELAPQAYLDPSSDRIFFGNPNLRDTRFTNVDTRYEYFFDEGQYFTVGAFYKDLSRPVESVVVQQGNTVQQSYVNAPAADIYGAEIEIKKIFDSPFDAGWLSNKSFLVQANYTYSDSEIKAEPGDTVIDPAGQTKDATTYLTVGSRLQGQSEHVANLQLGWEDDAEQGTLLVTYVSERSAARGPEGQPDIVQEPGVIMDFVYKRDFELRGHDMTFSFKAGNLLDEDYFEHQTYGGGEVIVNQYDLGRTFTVGLKASF
ncbi:MAG: TonB-dependent receptor [Hyphomonadaceae bacterium]